MDFEIGIEPVGLARQQRFELAARDFLLQRFQRGLGLGHDALVVLGLAEFDHADIVVEFALDLADAGQRILQRGALLHQLLGLLGIVPEIGIFGELVQLGEARRGLHRRQRCLLSSPTDCLISSTRRSTSARMLFSDLAVHAAMQMSRRDVAARGRKAQSPELANRRAIIGASTVRRCRGA